MALKDVKTKSGSYGADGHAQGDAQLVGQVARLLLFQARLELLSLQTDGHLDERIRALDDGRVKSAGTS